MEGRQRDEFISQVLSTIEESEVLTIFFPNLAKALVVDIRRSSLEGPMVKVVNQVSSMEERMASIEKMRPRLGPVRRIAGIPWFKSVRTLKENEVMAGLQSRLAASGMEPFEAARVCGEAFEKLKEIELSQWIDLIKGESIAYRTLWQQT